MSTTLQNKLLQFAPQPPEKVWDAIASMLDQTVATGFAEKLQTFEEIPPPQVWDKINNQLQTPQPARVVPFFQRYKKLAAAAAVLIFASITATLLISKKAEPTTVATTPATIQNQRIINHSNSSSDQPTTENSFSLVTSGVNKAPDQKNSIREKKSLFNRLHPQTDFSSALIAKAFIPRKAETRQTVSSDIPLEKYMVYSDGDGNAMKLPKKLFDFISCAKEDITCKQEMQQLQQQFASAVLTTDFTGVIEILETLKEK